jgi:murein DD-endopeptidase MepM/ murein hydrolase activator NlpD
MSSVSVGYGEQVSKGETIGLMGSTGRSTGPHVHFTIKYQGVPVDPLGLVN